MSTRVILEYAPIKYGTIDEAKESRKTTRFLSLSEDGLSIVIKAQAPERKNS